MLLPLSCFLTRPCVAGAGLVTVPTRQFANSHPKREPHWVFEALETRGEHLRCSETGCGGGEVDGRFRHTHTDRGRVKRWSLRSYMEKK